MSLQDVNGGLTREPRRSAPLHRSDEEIAKATARMIRAMGRRLADSDPHDLHLLRLLDEAVEDAWRMAVAGWYRTGYSYAEVAEHLGVSRQAVHQKWPKDQPLEGT